MVAGLPKNVVQRYFFHFRVPLWYTDIQNLLKLLEAPTYDVTQFPKRYSATNLILIKRALEDCRRNEGLTTRECAKAETNLLEAAADMGDSTAVALLCGSRMRQPDVTHDDMTSGSDLLRQLMDANFPLAFKISGDIAVSLNRPGEAEIFYRNALKSGLKDNRLQTECWRNLGYFALQKSDLIRAREWFSKACQNAEDPKQVLDCHFMLAQLREPDREAVRRHLEASAAYGFHNAFLPLGSLLLNWFNEPLLAKEWFKLASVTDKTGAALIGLLDSAVKLQDWDYAARIIVRIEGIDSLGKELLKTRHHAVKTIEKHHRSSSSNAKNKAHDTGRFGAF